MHSKAPVLLYVHQGTCTSIGSPLLANSRSMPDIAKCIEAELYLANH